jgi:NADH:ubiquinone oxidoreductase subunit K
MNCISILLLNLLLLSIGVITLFNMSSIIHIIVCIDLIIQSAISNFVFLNKLYSNAPEGQIIALCIAAISVYEMILFLTILLNLYNYYNIYNIKVQI